MRIVLVSAVVFLTASCAWAPPPPAPAPGIAGPPPVAVGYPPMPLFWGSLFGAGPPLPGRLTLRNFSFDTARVQAVITSFPDCAIRDGTAATDFVLPVNGTRIIAAAPGADVCWRRELPPATAEGKRPRPPWTAWSRAYTASGRFIDSQL